MDKVYQHTLVEEKWYKIWEEKKYFTPKIDTSKKPYTILLPLPNANDPMHMGHALFTVEDILVRYHRMLGEPTLWLPGGDHAGIETQFVFEKKLAREGKSRFDFDRDTLYCMISDFVDQNKNINRDQMKRLGFSLDWTRYHFSLEPTIVEKILATFQKLHRDNLIYRTERLVNFCPKCGTAFSDLEVNHEERNDLLYFIDYGPIQIATARPETIFADTAIAVNPKDKRFSNVIGKTAIIPLINKEIPIITDDAIQIDFGTGALKVTPAHDQVDYEIGLRHKLPVISAINRFGRLINVPKQYKGLKVAAARQTVAEDLTKAGKLVKTEPLIHTVSVCYRCKSTIEPMLMPQWFVKTKPLAGPAIQAVKKGRTKIVPSKRFEKLYFDWLENIHDWNISRQIVWGPRLPVWYCLDCNLELEISFIDSKGQKISGAYKNLSAKYSFEEIAKGLQSMIAPLDAKYSVKKETCKTCGGNHILQETDTFDTWFLSGQWPLTTLNFPDGEDFKYFYPTSVLDTLWDILFFWVARMMMFGLYLTNDVPFRVIHLHSRVVDKHGQKMSKSKGNVVNPIEMVDKYGADALRFALVFGAAPGSDISLSEDKIRGMRNFSNKLWNISRFLTMYSSTSIPSHHSKSSSSDKKMLSEFKKVHKKVTSLIEKYQFGQAAETIYEFTWHTFADNYIEESKDLLKSGNRERLITLLAVFGGCLKLLHPFMPFITEEINHSLFPDAKPLIISNWN